MLKFVALWNLPEGMNEEEFEHWYEETHIPDARRIPGLRRYTVNRAPAAKRGEQRYYRMAELSFDSLEAVEKAMESPEWRHAFADARDKIADHTRVYFESREIPLDDPDHPEGSKDE